MPTPAHPAHQLAPGLRVVRRGRDHLQVGLYAGRRVVLPATAPVSRALAALSDHRTTEPGDTAAREVLETLVAEGCAVPVTTSPERSRRRLRTRVDVLGADGGAFAGTDVVGLLRDAGLGQVSAGSGPVLVLTTGEPDRAILDPLVRRGTAHLVVRLVDGAAVLGPFVVPGVTPCLRCLDGHLGVRDPDHVAVSSRYARATAQPRDDGVPDVTDPALVALALAWAVRDVAAYAEGREPSTWARTVELGPEPARQVQTAWKRHPDCGCCWPSGAGSSGRMEE